MKSLHFRRTHPFLSGITIVFLTAITLSIPAHADPACDDQYLGGQRPLPINDAMKKEGRLVCSPNGFESLNWGLSRTALWSAEHLTPERVQNGMLLKRKDSFHEESSVPESERAFLKDYARSGYDRGHMAPNKDMGDRRTQGECFTLANMIPQDPNNNRNLWEGIEEATRTYVREHGDVYVITGPIFPSHGQPAQWLQGRVLIPIQIYKILYDPRTHKAAAYLTPNAPGMKWEEKSVAEIEQLAQIQFFPGLPTAVENDRSWNLPTPTPHGYGKFRF